MKNFISKNKQWFGYLLFALILTVALLYYRFPSDALLDYLETTAERVNPRLALSFDNIAIGFPIGLKFVETEVALKDVPNGVILSADSLLFKPRIGSLLRGKSDFSFHCFAYDGDISGRVYFNKDLTRGSIDTEIELSDILIGDHAYFSQLIGRHIEGTLGGTVSYRGPYNVMMDGSGEANLNLSQCRLELLEPFLSFESFDFNEIQIEMALNKDKLKVTRLEMKGQELHGTLSGTITLKEKLAKSSLDLRGTIEPFAAFFKNAPGTHDTVKLFKQRLKRGTLSFVINGTLGDPRVNFT